MLKWIMAQLKQIVPEEELEPRVFWRTYGVIAWVSFLFAGIGSMLFFATFDPVEIANLATYPTELTPIEGYTIGFFLFWIFGFCCTSASCILLSLPLKKRRKELPEWTDEEL